MNLRDTILYDCNNLDEVYIDRGPYCSKEDVYIYIEDYS